MNHLSHCQKQLRDEVVFEALTWLRTPWHHAARIKGVGVDCVNLLIAVYSKVGLIDEFNLEAYPRDWNLHRDEPLFIKGLLKFADVVSEPEIGDVAMFRFGRHAAHGGIIIEHDKVLHAYLNFGRVTITEISTSELQGRLTNYYRIRGL